MGSVVSRCPVHNASGQTIHYLQTEYIVKYLAYDSADLASYQAVDLDNKPRKIKRKT